MTPRGRLWALLAATLAGCESARHVVVEPSGGIVAVPGNSNVWPSYYRDSADKLIRDRCPKGYEVDREEAASIGTDTTDETGNTRVAPSVGGRKGAAPGPAPSGGSETYVWRTEARKEYQITYRSK